MQKMELILLVGQMWQIIIIFFIRDMEEEAVLHLTIAIDMELGDLQVDLAVVDLEVMVDGVVMLD